MKKIMNKINFAIIAVMASVPVFAAEAGSNDMCKLIVRLQDVFKFIRTLAFVGAAFMIAGWAWTYISKAGDDKAGFSIEDVKKKGIGLLVGFSLLFMIGLVLSFIMSTPGLESIGCKDVLTKGW